MLPKFSFLMEILGVEFAPNFIYGFNLPFIVVMQVECECKNDLYNNYASFFCILLGFIRLSIVPQIVESNICKFFI